MVATIAATAALLGVFASVLASKNDELNSANQQLDTSRKSVIASRERYVESAIGTIESANRSLSSIPGAAKFRTELMSQNFDLISVAADLGTLDTLPDDLAERLARAGVIAGNQLTKTDPESALLLARRTRELHDKYLDELPKDKANLILAEVCRLEGGILRMLNQEKASLDALESGQAALLAMSNDARNQPEAQRVSGPLLITLSNLQMDMLTYEAGLQTCQQLDQQYSKLLAAESPSFVDRIYGPMAISQLALMQMFSEQLDEAQTTAARAVAAARTQLNTRPERPQSALHPLSRPACQPEGSQCKVSRCGCRRDRATCSYAAAVRRVPGRASVPLPVGLLQSSTMQFESR